MFGPIELYVKFTNKLKGNRCRIKNLNRNLSLESKFDDSDKIAFNVVPETHCHGAL